MLDYRFWRDFVEIENVVAIKVAPFNRYRTIDVVRAVAESGRDIALYTGNDDTIVTDLVTPFAFQVDGQARTLHIVGGLLGPLGGVDAAVQWKCSRSVTQRCGRRMPFRTV